MSIFQGRYKSSMSGSLALSEVFWIRTLSEVATSTTLPLLRSLAFSLERERSPWLHHTMHNLELWWLRSMVSGRNGWLLMEIGQIGCACGGFVRHQVGG